MDIAELEKICDLVDMAMCAIGLSGRVVNGYFTQDTIVCTWMLGAENAQFAPRPGATIPQMSEAKFEQYLCNRLGAGTQYVAQNPYFIISIPRRDTNDVCRTLPVLPQAHGLPNMDAARRYVPGLRGWQSSTNKTG